MLFNVEATLGFMDLALLPHSFAPSFEGGVASPWTEVQQASAKSDNGSAGAELNLARTRGGAAQVQLGNLWPFTYPTAFAGVRPACLPS